MRESSITARRHRRLLPVVLLAAALATAPLLGAESDSDPFANLSWRSIGPVNMSGRVADVEGVPGNPNLLYVGAASGGVWKTTDGGLTFEPIFDDQPIASIGDLATAPSNPDVIYVGSGESNARNSVSFGDGVYKSPDGGRTWMHLGLEDTRHISRVLVHPNDPDTVYVAAMGHFWGANEDRGVFRTRDGGASWDKVLYLDDEHGASDMDMDPTNPNILYAGLWHFDRKPWTHTTGSEKGGVWKSVDGGDTWSKLEKGLPEGVIGRIGVKVAPSNPQVVYVIAESDEGTLFRSDDRGDSFTQVSDNVRIVSRGLYYTDIRIDPADENRVYAVSSRLFLSIDGGRTFERISRSTHVDYHSLWIDPLDPNRVWQGQDGGIAVSYDRGGTWEPIRNLPLAQFYQIFHDDREPFYYVGGGLQDNGTWYGPSRTREPAGILQDDWRMMSFGDAYFVVPHPEIEDLFLSESQAGGIVRTDMRTRQQIDVSPQPRRNDGGPVGDLEYRFNWNAPIIASPHDPMTVYFAGNVVFKTTDFGDTWERLSEDLTTDDPDKQGEAGGPAWTENTTAEYHCTLISFAESPVRAGVLWAGSDDGLIHVSRDGGATWSNVTGNLVEIPEFSPVSHLEPSRSAAGTAWATFDRHMFDDLRPHIRRTDDFGASWRSVSTEGLPETAWIWVLRQDPKSPDLLWVGTELGLYASRGGSAWRRMHLENLPTVAVHDILIHPRANDLLLGTHGRAIWVFDDATPLQQFDAGSASSAVQLYDPRPAIRFPTRFTRYGLGDKRHRAPNPPAGALITYHLPEDLLPEDPEESASELDDENAEAEAAGEGAEEDQEERIGLEILDPSGEVVRTIGAEELGKKAGLSRVAWNLAHDAHRERTDDAPPVSEFRPAPRGPMVLPGTYTVRLTVDGESIDKPVEVGVDPLVSVSAADLERQFQIASRLTEMRSSVNDGLRGLDAVAAQIEARRATAKQLKVDLSDATTAAVEDFEEASGEILSGLTRDADKPFWSQGPRLVERIGELFSAVDSQFAAPTAAQMGYYEELQSEYRERMAELNRHFAEAVPALNSALEASGVPPLAVPGPIEIIE